MLGCPICLFRSLCREHRVVLLLRCASRPPSHMELTGHARLALSQNAQAASNMCLIRVAGVFFEILVLCFALQQSGSSFQSCLWFRLMAKPAQHVLTIVPTIAGALGEVMLSTHMVPDYTLTGVGEESGSNRGSGSTREGPADVPVAMVAKYLEAWCMNRTVLVEGEAAIQALRIAILAMKAEIGKPRVRLEIPQVWKRIHIDWNDSLLEGHHRRSYSQTLWMEPHRLRFWEMRCPLYRAHFLEALERASGWAGWHRPTNNTSCAYCDQTSRRRSWAHRRHRT